MALQSMTGFARHEGQFDDASWVWELRSVNGKGLDLRFRLPTGYETIEGKVRKIGQSMLSRGNVQISLQTLQSFSTATPVINESVVDAIISNAEKLRERVGGDMPDVAELLNIRGVLEFEEAAVSEDAREAFEKEVVSSFEQALSELVKARATEGAAIEAVLKSQIDKIAALHTSIEANEDRSLEAIRARMKEQLDRLIEDNDKLDQQRLHQEAALLAAKADIQEELDRLSVHLDSATKLLAGDGPIGRKLDFLSQEFNRECNTICSKSNSASVSSLGLDMKLVIDQFREQIQNME